ncbi:MAG: DNA primase, partial [Clostridia bacterium]|nr:DNA primase [Clostridia bacterium]
AYVDAVRFLAERVGMDMPEEIDDRRLMAQKLRRERIYEANREAAVYYMKALYSEQGGGARRYLESRSVSFETAKKFGLGFSPDGFDTLCSYLMEKGFSREVLLDAGLAVRGRKDEEQTFDFFRGRLMFPVVNAAGKVIAFGGRTMGSDEPKYINTGDTPVYNKRENIYAINLLKGKKLDDIIMVEGYMDVISLHQHGIENAVASLGTALTAQQAKLIKRYAQKVYYAYDGDEAGQKAMVRGIDILRESELEPRVIVIPEGRDPDEYVKAFGTESFLTLKDASITGVRFKLERIAKLQGLETADGREHFAKEACALLSGLEPVERDRYIPFVAEKSGLSQQTVREQCGVSSAAPSNSESPARYINYKRPRRDSSRVKSEVKLLACMMCSNEAGMEISSAKEFSLMLFTSPALRAFCARLIAAYSSVRKADIPVMIADLSAEDAELVSEAYSQTEDLLSPVSAAEDIIASLGEMEIQDRLAELSAAVSGALTPEDREAAVAEYTKEFTRLRELKAARGEK